MNKKIFVIFCFLISASFLFSGCDTNENKAEKAVKNQILYLGNGQEPESLDPHTSTGIPARRIITSLLEGLVTQNPKTLKPMPGIAKKWEKTNDGKVYTFYLRENAEWSNGDPVLASDFVFSYKRVLSPELAARYANMLYCMKNAEEYNEGEIKDFSKVGVKAIGKHKLQIILDEPVPYFLSLLTNPVWLPVNPKVIKKYGKIDERETNWTKPDNFVSNGPFKLADWKINDYIKIKKNKEYWDSDKVKLNEVYFYPISDAQTEEKAFRNGQLHVTYTIPTNKIQKYKKEHPGLIQIDPYLGTFYLILNMDKKIFKKQKLRKALALSINRKSLAENVVKGGKLSAFSFTPPGIKGYKSGKLFNKDIKKAKRLLKEAGYPNGEGLPTLKLIYNTSSKIRKIAVAIQAMWKDNLNIEVSLINKEWKVYLDTFNTRNFDIATASWIGDYADPDTFLNLWVTNAGNNRANWSNKKYDKYIKKASHTFDNDKRFDYFKKAEKILMEKFPIIPLYHYTSLSLIKPQVKGWYSNILDRHPLKHVYLESQKKGSNKSKK